MTKRSAPVRKTKANDGILRAVFNAEPIPPLEEPKCPVVPLGHRQGIYYFLSPSGELRALGFRELTTNGIASLFDGDITWLEEQFPHFEGKGKRRRADGFDVSATAQALMVMSRREGLFDLSMPVRGPGVWRCAQSELIIHCGDQLIRVHGAAQKNGETESAGQKIGQIIYAAAPRVVPPDFLNPASRSEAASVLERLRAWDYEGTQLGPDIVIGWCGLAHLAGAPDWRVHFMLKGPRGSGKSSLTEYVSALLGAGAHPSFNDFSEAGLRQALTGEARAIILDESESEERGASRVAAVIALIRRMSSGDGARSIRGTAGHAAHGFSVTGCAWLSAILQPPLKPQDRSRIVEVYLAPLPKGPETARQSDLVRVWTDEARTLSPRLRARALLGWPRFRETLALYRDAFLRAGLDVRGSDKISALLAGRDLLLQDTPPDSDSIEEDVRRFRPLVAAMADDAQDGEGEECLLHLFTSAADLWRSGERSTIGQLVLAAMGKEDAHLGYIAAQRSLEAIGLAYKQHPSGDESQAVLYVANQHQGLARIFEGTRWEGGKWRDALHFLPKAAAGRRLRFAGSPLTRTVELPAIYLPFSAEAADTSISTDVNQSLD